MTVEWNITLYYAHNVSINPNIRGININRLKLKEVAAIVEINRNLNSKVFAKSMNMIKIHPNKSS